MIRLALALALLGYSAAWFLQLARFRGTVAGGSGRFSFLLAAPLLAHAGALAGSWVGTGAAPLVGFGPASATLALAIAATLSIVVRLSGDGSPALLALPGVGILLGAAVWVGVAPAEPVTAFRGPWLVIHVGAVFSGYAGLLLGSVAAIMYLLQFRALKRKEFGNVFRSFPSLESLDRMIGIAVGSGLSVLMIGLLVGLSFEATFGDGLELRDPAVGYGILTWAAYAAALAIRWTPGGRGRLAALMTVVAFGSSSIAFIALRALTETDGFFL